MLAPVSPQEPVRLGEYSLLEKLGQGGMALVYRAERVGEAGFKKKVAIKRMLPAYRRDRSLLERFAAEARTNARLDHPNLVHVVDFGIDPEPYLVMEFVEGVTLASLLQRLVDQRQQLEIAAACFIGAEAAQGLDYAHRKRDEQGSPLGIVHRDVSPQNVLLSNEGAVKVSDFGLVKAADNVVQTGSGIPIGKMSYMAPEQAQHVPVDARADVFSLGIVVWEMLTMRTLMPPNDPARASQMLVACEFKPPSRYNPKVPPALDEIVMRCLSRQPEQRTPSAQALSMQLREVLHELAPGYGRDQLARLLGWAFPEKGWIIDEPHETAAQPSAAERMSMPQIAAADAMQRAAQGASANDAQRAPPAAAPHTTGGHPAMPAPYTTGGHPAMPAPYTTGGHPAMPHVSGEHAAMPRPTPRSSAGLWLVLLAIAGVIGLAFMVVFLAIAIFALSAEPNESSPAQPAPASATTGAALTIVSNVAGARVFVGDREIGVAPVTIGSSHLTGQPLVVIAAGFQPKLLAADELARAVDDGRGRETITLAPTARPYRVVLVRHPRPATARGAFTNEPLGPVPGILIVPPMSFGDLAPQIEILEPGYPALRMSTASCDVTRVCVLDGGAL